MGWIGRLAAVTHYIQLNTSGIDQVLLDINLDVWAVLTRTAALVS